MGNNVLIIGASGDIGSEIAINLGKTGYQLLLHYHKNKEKIKYIKQHVNEECILSSYKADLRLDSEINTFLEQLVFSVDTIVFSSGFAHYGLLQDTPERIMDDMLSLQVKAPWFICKSLLPEMIRRKSGKIIFITSIWGEVGASNEVIYSSVKGAQNSFVKALAKEVGPSGISVNAISPGFIDTKMNQHFLTNDKKTIVADIPLNRAGTVEEVAHAVKFLLDNKANYINGEIIRIDGGWY